MKNKRSLCLILIAAVALAVIAFGAGQYLGAGHLSLDSDKDNFTFPWTKAHQTTVRKKLDAFDRADIHLDNTDITLQDGDDFAMVYHGPKGTCPTLTVTDGKLTAKAAKTAVGAHQDAELTLTIPRARAELKTLTLAADNGDITVEPAQTFRTLTLESQNGDIDIDACDGTTLKATTSNGDIDLESTAFTTAELTADNGDISAAPADSLARYTISAKTNTGDIDIGEREYNAGTIRVGSGDKTITAHTNTGDIDIEND
ncbi:DUF4097 family beta strand repeat-containing protein [Pseudoramibacter porci]|uniref:DUF4097 domain-containing protein n=1 Tax=Pseudoramibacter porci TaxID=2606631 RepID=A0A7X2NGP1_9FIRM|nr:DUF4097 family beta strand repeat-containing protein [Pseudoramibacter porci]MSS20205.1 DUF4097 domain-containing protein [Pseudoramibacter porci]